jgi:exopolysaccharide biosynthesis polyprenyl glycosylphosphotransferase
MDQTYSTSQLNVSPPGVSIETLAERTRRTFKEKTAAFRHSRTRCERLIACFVVVGDLGMILAGFLTSFWLRYYSGFFEFLSPLPALPATAAAAAAPVVLWDYWKLILLGTLFVFGGLINKNTYEHRDLLGLRRFINRFAGLLSFCLFVFIGLSLAVQTSPPISRAWVILSWFTILFLVVAWRFVVRQTLHHPFWVGRLRKRVVVVGATPETIQIQQSLQNSLEFEYVGWVESTLTNRHQELRPTRLGALHQLEDLLRDHFADVVIVSEIEQLQREGVAYVLRTCERQHVQFKLVPHFIETLISGLRPSKLGGVALLGVDSLPLQAYQNRVLKRTVDIIGGTLGLILSAPFMAFFGALVYLESPGPILYRQRRTTRGGQEFIIFKIRSMRMDAEASGRPGWSRPDDDRRLRVGAFMRRWNIDEVPQFYNVLRGDMSLVGPRPERPELIEHFQHTIPHYQLRHHCRAGMTGWAQVNGWRGDTDLVERIRCDIWYVEHWNPLLDLRIMFQTLFRTKNAC